MPTPREMIDTAQRQRLVEERLKRAGARRADEQRTGERQTGKSPSGSFTENDGKPTSAPESRGTRAKAPQSQRAPQPRRTSKPQQMAPQAPRQVPHRPNSRHMRSVVTRWRMFGIAAFAALMILGGIIGLLFFARPTSSTVEMRNLEPFPEFTVESFLDGSFFTELSLWYADTYPLREPMVAADHWIDSLFGLHPDTGMVGGNVQADEIPTEAHGEPIVITPPAAAPDERMVDADIQENISSTVYISEGSGYSIYYFSQYAADTYITALNTAAKRLDGVSTVYSIMAPANCITLPDEQALAVGGSDQQQTLDYLSTRFDKRVKAVKLVDTVKAHRNEYLYFHTDHHWTQLGAYYGYLEFCEQKGIAPKKLSDWKNVNLGEFEGTYAEMIESMCGYTTPDNIDAYIPSSTNDMTYWTADGAEVESSVVNEGAASWEPPYKYSGFIAGDQPLEIIHNPTLDDGSSCLVVKDSYGCAFVPLLVDHYETVYVIDFRKTDKNICDYAIENGIDDVIFMTGIKIGLTDSVAETLLSEVS